MLESLDMLSALAAPRSPGRVIGRRQGKAVREDEFFARARAWCARARRTRGRAFALYLSDSIEFAAALLGAWQAGKTIYLPGDKLPGTCAALRRSVDGFWGEFAPEWEPAAPADEAALGEDFHRLDPEFSGLVLYTSGSTGAPAAIPKKLAQIAAEVATLEKEFGALIGGADVIATVSHQHIYGLLFKVLWPLAAGRALHARSLSFLEEMAAAAADRDYILVSTPAHLKRLPENPAWTATGRLKAVFSSGGPLASEVARATDRLLGTAPIEVYGSSETGGVAWRRQRERDDETWTPFPGVAWRIDPEDGALAVRSPNLPDESWFRTADRAAPAGAGFVLLGRIDRLVKIEEKRISLDAIESQLAASPLVSAARAIVLEGRRRRIAAFVVLSDEGRKLAGLGKPGLDRTLRDALGRSIDAVGLPRVWRYLDAFPADAQGKTTHAELLALIENGRAKTMPLERCVEQDARRAVFELVPPENLLYFDGHFTGTPILAGVVQVDWVIHYGRRCFDLPPAFRAIHGLKFQRVIPPETPILLELIHDAAESSLSFKITSREGPHASGRVLFGAPDVKPCVIVPVYNHERAVGAVVEAVLAENLPCILVDDGSARECAAVLDRLAAGRPDRIILIRHAVNRGKGVAVLAAIRRAAEEGYTHAVQIDADGQHRVADLPRFLAQAAAHPEALIAGCPEYDAAVPRLRFYARYLTHIWVAINTLSRAIGDSMCGFRVYPVEPVLALDRRRRLGARMNFDIEVAVRLYWDGVEIINLPTPVRYPPGGVSHFRLWSDNLRISRMHAALFFGMLVRLPMLIARKWGAE